MSLNSSEWELSKENVRPLKTGRQIQALNEVLSDHSKVTLHEQKRQREEDLVKQCAVDVSDPLSLHISHLKWVDQHFPTSAGQEYRKSLLTTMKLFMDDPRYTDDPQMLYCWSRLAELSSSVGRIGVFENMFERGACCRLADFYVEWAAAVEMDPEQKLAPDYCDRVKKIFLSGRQHIAQPAEKLDEAEKNFELRFARMCLQTQQSASDDDDCTRNFLGVLPAVKRGGSARTPYHRESVQSTVPLVQQQRLSSLPAPSAGFSIHGTQEDAQNTASGHVKILGVEQMLSRDIDKENVRDPGKWPSQKLDRHSTTTVRAATIATKSPFEVFAEAPQGQVPQAAVSKPVPKEICMYPKHLIYDEGGVEVSSIEELMAARWFEKEKQRKQQIELEENRERERLEAAKRCMEKHTSQMGHKRSFEEDQHHARRALLPVVMDATLSSPVPDTATACFRREQLNEIYGTSLAQSQYLDESVAANMSSSNVSVGSRPSKSRPPQYTDSATYPESHPSSGAAFEVFVEKKQSSSLFDIKRDDVENIPPAGYHAQTSGFARQGPLADLGPTPSSSFRIHQDEEQQTQSTSASGSSFPSFDPNESTVAGFRDRIVRPKAGLASTPSRGAVPPPSFSSCVSKPWEVSHAPPSADAEMPSPVARGHGHEAVNTEQPLRADVEPMQYETGFQPLSESDACAALHTTTPANITSKAKLSTVVETSREYRSGSSSGSSTCASSGFRSNYTHTRGMSTISEGGDGFNTFDAGSTGRLPSRHEHARMDGQPPHMLLDRLHIYSDVDAQAEVDDEDAAVVPLKSRTEKTKLGENGISADVEHTGVGVPTFITSAIDPFNPLTQFKLLRNARDFNQFTSFHEFECSMPEIQCGRVVELGGENYQVLEKIGEGAFAVAYKCQQLDQENSENQKNFLCLKVQKPTNMWEFYLSSEAIDRLERCDSGEVRSMVGTRNDPNTAFMRIHDGYFFQDGNVLVNDYHANGTLLDVGNKYIQQGRNMHEMICIYFTIELLRIVKALHNCNVIHGDVKPDNLLLVKAPPLFNSIDDIRVAFDRPTLKLIDFGRSIDMSLLKPGQTFTGSADTSCFKCPEMVNGTPWSWQTDYFGIIAVAHVILFQKYLKFNSSASGTATINSSFRRKDASDLWKTFFHSVLNIPSVDELPNLHEFRVQFERHLFEWLNRPNLGKPNHLDVWNAAVRQFMNIVHSESSQ